MTRFNLKKIVTLLLLCSMFVAVMPRQIAIAETEITDDTTDVLESDSQDTQSVETDVNEQNNNDESLTDIEVEKVEIDEVQEAKIKEDEVQSIVELETGAVLTSMNKSARNLVTGTIGTVPFTFDDMGVLTFEGGKFVRTLTWETVYKNAGVNVRDIKKIIYNAPVEAPVNMSEFYQNMIFLEEIVNLNNLDTSKTTDMTSLFYKCISLKAIDFTGFNTSNVTKMNTMFFACEGLKNLDLRAFDTSKVTQMIRMFADVKYIESIDVSTWDTRNVDDMSYLFGACENIKSIDVSNFNTANVTNFTGMFSSMKKLESLDVSNFNTSKATKFIGMFYGDEKITELDLTNFDTRAAQTMQLMFAQCSTLKKLDISSFDVSSVTNMSEMFEGAHPNELKLGPKFKFHSTFTQNFSLLIDMQVKVYTGNWQMVGTGTAEAPNGDVFTREEFLTYDGSRPGTYAWQRVTYQVNYLLEGGNEPAPANEVLLPGSLVTKPQDPTKDGFVFDKWVTESGGTTAWNFDTDVMPLSNVSLYAKWIPIPPSSYKVEHYQEQLDGSYVMFESTTQQGTVGDTVQALNNEYVGYTHDATNSNNVLTGVVTADGNLTLKVYYTRNVYSITFKDHDGTVLATITGKHGTPITLPANPIRLLYVFSHWSEVLRVALPRAMYVTIPTHNVVYIANYLSTTVPPTPEVVVKPIQTPAPAIGRTCQDDGYANGYTWNGTACVLQGGYTVPNTGVK